MATRVVQFPLEGTGQRWNNFLHASSFFKLIVFHSRRESAMKDSAFSAQNLADCYLRGRSIQARHRIRKSVDKKILVNVFL